MLIRRYSSIMLCEVGDYCILKEAGKGADYMKWASPADRAGSASRAEISNQLPEDPSPGWLRLEVGVIVLAH